jgi:hypothetical protein
MSLITELEINLDKLTLDNVLDLYEMSNYPLFTNGDYNLNIFGLRNPKGRADEFDDVIGILYKKRVIWELFQMKATTDPGVYYMKNPMVADGCGILAEGFYRGMWKTGYFHGVKCLIQKGVIRYYRDNNRDLIHDLDTKTLKSGGAEIGCFMHPHFQNVQIAKKVWNSSAMCQVPQSNNDFATFMGIVEKAIPLFGDSFSYSLFN